MCGKWWSGALAEENAADIGGFTEHQPEAFGLVFDRLTEPQIQPAVVAALREKARVWVNTLWYGLAAGYTDETSLRDPALGWGAVVDRHQADMIQTDNPEQLVSWLASRDNTYGGRGEWPSLPKGSVRVQAEDYSLEGKGIGYHDLDDENRGGTVAREYEGMDICDQSGAVTRLRRNSRRRYTHSRNRRYRSDAVWVWTWASCSAASDMSAPR